MKSLPIDRKNPDKHRNRLRELSPTGFDYIVEATGSTVVCEDALQFARRGGTLLVYGVYPEKETVRFNPFDLFRREITIKGSFAQIDAFPRALAYLESGKIKVNEIVTDEFAVGGLGESSGTRLVAKRDQDRGDPTVIAERATTASARGCPSPRRNTCEEHRP